MIDELTIDTTDDSDNDKEDLFADDDRQLIDRAFGRGPSTGQTSISTDILTNSRRKLSEQFKDQFDEQFLEDVLPLP